MAARAFLFQKSAQLQGHVGGGDFHRTDRRAATAARTMLHHGPQFRQNGGIGLALVDLRIVDRLDDGPEHHVLVARVEMIGTFRVHHGADLLALAAAGAHLHRGQQVDEPLLVGQAALTDVLNQTVEGEGEGPHGKLALRELGGVEDVAGIDALLELPDGVHLVLAEEGDLGDADAVLARDRAPHLLRLGHDAHGGFLGDLQHVQVVGVDRDVDVAVTVARVHVAGDHDAPGQHVVADLLDLGSETVVAFRHEAKELHGAGFHLFVGQLGGRNPALRHAGHVDEFAVEIAVLQRHAGQTPQFLQCLAVGHRRAFKIELLQKEREIRDALHGDDHVLVDLEAGGTAGNGGQAVAILPEKLGFLLVPGKKQVDVFFRVYDGRDFLYAFLQQIGLIAVHLKDDDRYGQPFVLGGFFLIVDGAHVFGVEFFQRGKPGVVAILPDAVAQAHDLADDHRGLMHGAAIEFQHHHPRVRGLLVHDEGGVGDDAVHAFLLHTGQTAERLVGDVLAEAGEPDFRAVQLHHAAHAAAEVLDLENRHLFGKNLVTRVILALDGDDLPGRSDHAPREQVVERGPVFKGEGAARIFRHVAADGRSRLRGRVHGKEEALPGDGVDGRLGDDPGVQRDAHVVPVHRGDFGKARGAHDDRAPAHGDGTAGKPGGPASGNEGEL